jgi:hypothetical protein
MSLPLILGICGSIIYPTCNKIKKIVILFRTELPKGPSLARVILHDAGNDKA